MSSSPIRSTQRAPKSCISCYARRVKCSKTIPCTACIKRGQEATCRREVVNVKGRVHNVEAPEQQAVEDLQKEVYRLRKRVEELELETERAGSPYRSMEPPIRVVSASPVDHLPPVEAPESHDSVLKAIDFMSMGLDAVPRAAWETSRHMPLSGDSFEVLHSTLALVLPKRSQVGFLLEWGHEWIWWHHCAYHVPMFRKEVEEMWSTDMRSVSWSWAALFLSALSVSLFYMPPETARGIGLTDGQISSLPNVWFQASLQCLQNANYLAEPSLSSVQTIVILCGIANSLGHGSLNSVLLAIGVRVAHLLSIHRLGIEPLCNHKVGSSCASHGETRPHLVMDRNVIVRETARRCWVSLIVTERAGLLARDRRGVSAAGSSVPLNMDDVEEGQVALIRPIEAPTMVTQHLAMYECAAAIYRCCAAWGGEEVPLQRADAELSGLLQRPAYSGPLTKFEWLPWARHTWTICVHHKRMVLSRGAFARSYKDPGYEAERQHCLSAARAIIHERHAPFPPCFDRIWANTGHLVAAIVVLIMAYFHDPPSDPEYWGKRAEIDAAVALLTPMMDNPFVQRASRLLRSLLAEEHSFRSLNVSQSVRQVREDEPQDGVTAKPTVATEPSREAEAFLSDFEDVIGSNEWWSSFDFGSIMNEV